MTGKQLVEHCAQSVHVRCTRKQGVVTDGLLWRHVTRGAHYLLRLRDGALRFH
jgi:hypothetical protein